jgi:nitrite reductase/ring-hydroxylating ferredoxin subunit
MTVRHPRAVRLCALVDLPEGSARGFDPDGSGADTVFILSRPTGLRAFRNWCPHQGVPLEYRKDAFLAADGEHVMCYAHGALFDPDTGDCVEGACLGQSLRPIACWEEADGVWIRSLDA